MEHQQKSNTTQNIPINESDLCIFSPSAKESSTLGHSYHTGQYSFSQASEQLLKQWTEITQNNNEQTIITQNNQKKRLFRSCQIIDQSRSSSHMLPPEAKKAALDIPFYESLPQSAYDIELLATTGHKEEQCCFYKLANNLEDNNKTRQFCHSQNQTNITNESNYQKYQTNWPSFNQQTNLNNHLKNIYCTNCEILQHRIKTLEEDHLHLNLQIIQQQKYINQLKFFENCQSEQAFSDLLIQKLNKMSKILQKYTKSINFRYLYFTQGQKNIIKNFDLQFCEFELLVGLKEKNHKQNSKNKELHAKCKKIISSLVDTFKFKQAKTENDFNQVMRGISQNKIKGNADSSPSQNRSVQKNIEAQSLREQQLQKLNRRCEQQRFNYQKQITKYRYLLKIQKQERAKKQSEASVLQKQKLKLCDMIQKQANDFSQFIKVLVLKNQPDQKKSNFFQEVSRKIFEISNCIPFQQNDEQNLFAAESYEELFEMIERIRRFATNIEVHTANQQKHHILMKNRFTMLIKELIDAKKVNIGFLYELITSHPQIQLNYILEMLNKIRKRLKKRSNSLTFSNILQFTQRGSNDKQKVLQ